MPHPVGPVNPQPAQGTLSWGPSTGVRSVGECFLPRDASRETVDMRKEADAPKSQL